MQISHEEAHTLIQFSLDRELDPGEKNALSAHLNTCAKCDSFRYDLTTIEASLYKLSTSHKQIRHTPIAIDKLAGRVATKEIWLRPAAITSLIVMITFMLTWQFPEGKSVPNAAVPHLITAIPTPSILATDINLTSQGCKKINYIIQEGDTLQSIANAFKISQRSIELHNDLSITTLKAGTEVTVRLCNGAASQTVSPFISTTTLTLPASFLTVTQ